MLIVEIYNTPTLVNITVMRRELDTKVTSCSVDCGNPVSNLKFYLVTRQIVTLLIESLFLAAFYQFFSLQFATLMRLGVACYKFL